MRQNDLVTHFHKTFPGSPEDWALSKEQFAYMDGDIAAYPDETNPNAQPDPFIPYNGTKKGLMPWILPYRCANRGYKVGLLYTVYLVNRFTYQYYFLAVM